MEITPLQMYILLMLDKIVKISGHSVVILLFILVPLIVFVIGNELNYEDSGKCVKLAKILGVAFLLSLFTYMFCPTTKQAAAIILVPKVINNEKIQDIGSNTLNVADNLLKLSNEYIKNLYEKNNDEGVEK